MSETPTFDVHTTGLDVVKAFPERVKGKTFVITGPGENSIGGQTALDLAEGKPRELILVSRKGSTVNPIVEKIAAIDPSISVRFIQMDLASLESVKRAAAEINESISQIDAIINNAAIMGTPWAVTKEGIEIQFGVNHIGHFLFTNLLIPKISPGGRIVNVSSSGHCMSGIRFDDYNFQNGKVYDEWDAYGQAKTANVLFSIELAKRLKSRNIQSFSLHPANTSSGLAAHLDNPNWDEVFKKFGDYPVPVGKTKLESSATQLAAALDPRLAEFSGAYLNDCVPFPQANCAKSPKDAEKLWTLSELLVQQKFSY